jgi:hypothetical protein
VTRARIQPGLHLEDRAPAPDAPFATLLPGDPTRLVETARDQAIFQWCHGGRWDPTSRVQRHRLEKQLEQDYPAGAYTWSLDEGGDASLVIAFPELGPLLGPPGPPIGQHALVLLAPRPAPDLDEAARRLAPLHLGYDGATVEAVLRAWPGALALRFFREQAQLFGPVEDLEALSEALG